ncbi:MAG: hypothetical protein ABFR82_05655 [Nitrospirota bacterium]
MMERPKVNLKLSFEYEKEKRTAPNISRENNTITLFEGLDLSTKGWAYHPALLKYRLELLPKWEQIIDRVEPDDKNESKTFFEGYITDITFLQYKPYTLRLFANRSRSTIRSNLAQRSKNIVDTYGGSVILKYELLPTTFDYAHTDTTQTGLFDYDEESDRLQMQMRYFKNLGDTQLKTLYTDTNTKSRGKKTGITEQKIDLINRYDINTKGELRTNLRYRNTEGSFFELTRYRAAEKFKWQHKKNLSTTYNYRYEKNEFSNTHSEISGLGFNLRHLLYENLTTSVSANGNKSQFSGSKELTYGGGVNLNYMRKIPWGRLNVIVGHTYTVTEEEEKSDLIEIADEPLTLTLGQITFLLNKNVNTGSIEIRNVPRTVTFQKDIDYRVTETDSFIRISCIPGGLLDTTLGCTAGAPVVVDYSYLRDPAHNFSTLAQNYGINLGLWSIWNIRYSYSRRTERFLSGTEPDQLINDEVHSVSTDINWRWSKTGFSYTLKDTVNLPSKEWNVNESLTFRPHKKVYINVTGNYGKTKFTNTGDTVTVSGAASNIQLLTTKKSRLILKGFANKISGPSENVVYSGLTAVYELMYRRLRVNIRYGFINDRDRIADEEITNNYFLIEARTVRF